MRAARRPLLARGDGTTTPTFLSLIPAPSHMNVIPPGRRAIDVIRGTADRLAGGWPDRIR
jgi:hypothetical protein